MINPLQLPDERPGHEAEAELLALRAVVQKALATGAFIVDPAPEESSLAGVRCLRYRSPGRARGVLFHIHGGGFRLGTAEMSAHFAAALAAMCQIDVVCPDYRLAPEHPFPAGLADSFNAFSELQKSSDDPVIISGDSGGGGLAAGVVLLACATEQPPQGLVLLSPWLDLTVSSEAFVEKEATDPIFSRTTAKKGAAMYLQGISARDPRASPLFSSVVGFPPTFISVGDGEVLLDDARDFHAKLQGSAVEAMLDIVPGMEHTAVARNLNLPGARDTLHRVAGFIRRRL